MNNKTNFDRLCKINKADAHICHVILLPGGTHFFRPDKKPVYRAWKDYFEMFDTTVPEEKEAAWNKIAELKEKEKS